MMRKNKKSLIRGQMTLHEWEDLLREQKNETAIRYIEWAKSLAQKFVHGDNYGQIFEDDLESECLYGLNKAIETYSPLRGVTFKTYASNVIRNQLIDLTRSSQKLGLYAGHEELDDKIPDSRMSIEDEVETRELLAHLYAAKKQLDPALRTGYEAMIHRQNGGSLIEFAKRKGIHARTLYRMVEQAEEDLKRYLRDRGYTTSA